MDTSSASPPTATGEHERSTVPQESDKSDNPVATEEHVRASVPTPAKVVGELTTEMGFLLHRIWNSFAEAKSPEDLARVTHFINAGFQDLIAKAQRQFDWLESMASTPEKQAELSKMAKEFFEVVHAQWHEALKVPSQLFKELEQVEGTAPAARRAELGAASGAAAILGRIGKAQPE